MLMIKDYQSVALSWMIGREQEEIKGGFLCDEVGLGKTIEILSLLNHSPKPLNLLVVPKILQFQWKEEAITWLSGYNIKIINKLSKITDSTFNQLYIISYSNFCYDVKINAHYINWDRLILDEGHLIKNRRSNTHKSICKLQSKIKWCVTATPVMNNISDLYGLMKLFDINKIDVDQNKEKLLSTLALRRTKEDVHLNLPALHIHNITEPMNDYEKYIYDTTSVKIRELMNGTEYNTLYVFELIMRLVQICISPSIYFKAINKKYNSQEDEVFEESTKIQMLRKVLSKNEKTLIFCKFKEEMNIYKKLFPDSYEINGNYSIDERCEILENFKNNKDVKLLFIQINIGNCGLNIQCANNVVFTSPTWNPSIEHQAIGRCYRTGQQKEVHVYKLYYTDTIEEKIIKAQNKKNELIKEIWDYLKNKI